jgi:transposase-like protein
VLLAGLIWDDPSPREAGTRLTTDGEDDTHRDHHGAQHVYVGGGGGRRVEVISGVDRRRRWGREEKSRIIAESFGEGVNVSEVARRNGVSIGLLHHCIRHERPTSSTQRFGRLGAAARPLRDGIGRHRHDAYAEQVLRLVRGRRDEPDRLAEGVDLFDGRRQSTPAFLHDLCGRRWERG